MSLSRSLVALLGFARGGLGSVRRVRVVAVAFAHSRSSIHARASPALLLSRSARFAGSACTKKGVTPLFLLFPSFPFIF
jgi:hypothetical protein